MPRLEPIPNAPGRSAGRRARSHRVSTSLAEINVVPLVDVMLVLLVIFMVAAPMMHQGYGVQLPKSSKSPAITAEPVTITIPLTFRQDQRVRLNDESVPLAVLPERINQELSGRVKRDVMLAADAQVTVQELMTVMDRVKAAGVLNVGMPTQPLIPGRRP